MQERTAALADSERRLAQAARMEALGRLAARDLASLRAGVRAEFLGATTCTHLNDMLRALADVGVLGAGLGGRVVRPAGRLP